MRDILAVSLRQLLLLTLFFLPGDRKRALERKLRGKQEYRKLQAADWVLMSWGKSGRTWFRVMLSRFYQLKFRLRQNALLEFDNLHRSNRAVPRVLFSHNNYLRDYLGDWSSLDHFRDKKLVLLARDPRDTAVSQYFQWKYRMRPHKKRLNGYPAHGENLTVFDFVMDARAGLPRIIEFLNGWAPLLAHHPDILLIRYEDMRSDPQAVMQRVLEFTGTPGSEQEIAAAVEFAAYENMKKLEKARFFRASGARVKPADSSNPQSFKVRRAKVGGYRDDFDPAQLAQIDAMVEERLDPVFGYSGSPAQADAERLMHRTA
jgi:hypothetical protein